MKNEWESPRGPVSIDPETRDIARTSIMRKVEKKNGEPYSIEFDTFPASKTRFIKQRTERGTLNDHKYLVAGCWRLQRPRWAWPARRRRTS